MAKTNLDDALGVATAVNKANLNKIKLCEDLFEHWVLEEIMPRGITCLRSSAFYDFARERVNSTELNSTDKEEFETLMRKAWKNKCRVGRIKRVKDRKNSYELNFEVKK